MKTVVRFAVVVTGVWLAFGALASADEQLGANDIIFIRQWGPTTVKVGPTMIYFSIEPQIDLDSLEVAIVPVGGLEITDVLFFGPVSGTQPAPLVGPALWKVPARKRSQTMMQVKAVIPSNDTSGIDATVYYHNRPIDSMGMYFIAAADSIAHFDNMPGRKPPGVPVTARDTLLNPEYPLAFTLDPVTVLHQHGPADLLFTITPRWQFDSLRITVTPIGTLYYDGPSSFPVSTTIGETSVFILPVIIPPNDTSGIIVDIFSNGNSINGIRRYFTTTDDTLKVFKGKPVPPSPPPWPIPFKDSSIMYDKAGPYRIDEVRRRGDTICTPQWQYHTLSEYEIEEMERLRKQKLPEHNIRPAEEIDFDVSQLMGKAQTQDSARQDIPMPVIIDLRKREDYDLVAKMKVELTATDSAGFYQTMLTKRQAAELRGKGIFITRPFSHSETVEETGRQAPKQCTEFHIFPSQR